MTAYNSSFEGATPFSDTGSKFNLAANTGLSFTVPGDISVRYRAKFSYTANANVWVSYNGTAVSPIAGTQSATYNQEFRPDIKFVKGGDVLNLISSDATGAQVGVSLLQIP
ncbi:MAG TPA: hypothetical protein VNX68_13865 [Nitrosopumilaceae archaeon]|jgi:hypothetical protein|nr:hypothetical protein [Nitrosopumilaceae archaeon]